MPSSAQATSSQRPFPRAYYTSRTTANLLSEGRAAVLALVSGLSSRDRRNRDLAMLQCFIDDSGHGTKPVLVLAGFVASVEAWLAFSDDWQAVLDQKPAFDYLRMREAWGCRYPVWSENERDRRLPLFREVIMKHALAGIQIAVPLEPYKRTVGQIPGWKDSYQYALYLLMKDYRRHHAKLGLERDVTFIFDEQRRQRRRIDKAWDFFQKQGTGPLLEIMGGRPKFEDDKKVKPLQAADFAAWVSRRRTAAALSGKEQPVFPWPKGDSIKTLGLFCSEDVLRHHYEQMVTGSPFDAAVMKSIGNRKIRKRGRPGEG
jgi:Protein of unknown function (DUF3800)